VVLEVEELVEVEVVLLVVAVVVVLVVEELMLLLVFLIHQKDFLLEYQNYEVLL
jgi:hypothetical protein